MLILSNKIRNYLDKLSTTNISDALDSLGLKGATYGIKPIVEIKGSPRIIGEAITIKITSAGLTKSKHHLGVKAIDIAKMGDVIVVDNGGRIDTSCWGGVLANGAKMKGISGVVIDGACRDVDEYIEINFPVYARGSVVATARGRIMEEATNVMIQFGGVQVHPGDIVVGDRSGVVIIPQVKLEEVISKAEEICKKEEKMVKDIKAGKSMLEVDNKYNYEKMLK